MIQSILHRNNTVKRTAYTAYESNELSKHPDFVKDKPIVVHVHGFHTNQDSVDVKRMVKAFVLDNQDYNFVTLDWAYFTFLDYFKQASLIARDVSLMIIESENRFLIWIFD